MKLVFRTSFLLFIFILSSCKKDKKDSLPPTITFNAPLNTPVYHVFDTVTVNARVSDNMHLSSINVVLTDLNHTPVQGSFSVPISSADFAFNLRYILSEFRLQTGTYLMQITADDGYNAVSSFQPIIIIESPTYWLGYCFNVKSNPQTIVGYDSSNAQNVNITITGAYNGMKYGGYNRQLYINGNSSQPFLSFDLVNNVPNYTVTATNSQLGYTCLYSDGSKPYIGFKNGNVYSYTNIGTESTSYRYTGANQSYAYYFTTTNTNNVAVYKNLVPSGNQDVLVSFYSLGAPANVTPLPAGITTVVGVFQKQQNDSLYVLGNDANNQAVAYIYTFSGGFSANSLAGFGGFGKMLSATKINNEFILFSTATGVYSCNGLNVNMASLLPAAQKISYQPKLNVLSVASGPNLNAYSVVTSTVGTTSFAPIAKMSKTFTDSIVDFEVITNK